jgi:hypothetical protein
MLEGTSWITFINLEINVYDSLAMENVTAKTEIGKNY